MAEPFLISKALDITPKALGKSASMVFKGIVVLLAIGWLLYSGYIMLVKPHFSPNPTTTNKAQNMSIQYVTIQEDSCWVKFFGMKAFCFKNEKVYEVIDKK